MIEPVKDEVHAILMVQYTRSTYQIANVAYVSEYFTLGFLSPALGLYPEYIATVTYCDICRYRTSPRRPNLRTPPPQKVLSFCVCFFFWEGGGAHRASYEVLLSRCSGYSEKFRLEAGIAVAYFVLLPLTEPTVQGVVDVTVQLIYICDLM